jgi:uncharacterized membrane protein YkvA (DUF1232 family)
MNFIKGLLSTIIVTAGIAFEYIVFSATNSTEEIGGKIFLALFGLLIVFPILVFLKWLWRNPTKETQATSISTDSPEVVVKVPVGIQYKLELSSPEQVIPQSPEVLSSQHEFKALTSFPKNLFLSESYDGWKFLVALLLFISTIYFMTGFPGFLSIHNDLSVPKTSGFIPFVWNSVFGNAASSKVSSIVDLFFRFFVFICSYCLAWISFDPKEAEGYAMGLFNIIVGILYMLTPLDAIPDFVPFVGALDDTFLGAGMILLGSSSWYKAKIRDKNTDTVLQLISDGNSNSAIQLLLKDKGVAVQYKK